MGVYATPTFLVNGDEYLGNPYGFDQIVIKGLESTVQRNR
jgi:hypothetical protein